MGLFQISFCSVFVHETINKIKEVQLCPNVGREVGLQVVAKVCQNRVFRITGSREWHSRRLERTA
jgi:hypothetical protein